MAKNKTTISVTKETREKRKDAKDIEKTTTLNNNTCPKCGGAVTGEQVEFISATRLTQDVTCDDCGKVFRHYYELVDMEEI